MFFDFGINPKLELKNQCQTFYDNSLDNPKWATQYFMRFLEHQKDRAARTECQRCHQKGLIHRISWDYSESISKIIMPDSNWLHEIVLGFAMADYDFIKEIYIHKIIGTKSNPLTQDQIESDIAIITSDDQLLLVEVTTQSDNSNIISNITPKAARIQELKIPYWKLMYSTSTDSTEYRDITKFKTRIFGIKHLYEMEEFVRALHF